MHSRDHLTVTGLAKHRSVKRPAIGIAKVPYEDVVLVSLVLGSDRNHPSHRTRLLVSFALLRGSKIAVVLPVKKPCETCPLGEVGRLC